MEFRTSAKCAVLTAVLMLWGGAARADLYEYNYTGNPYDEIYQTVSGEEIYSNTDYITMSFVTASIIPPDSFYTLSTFSVASDGVFQLYYFPLGPNNIGNTYDGLSYGFVETNSTGLIYNWSFQINWAFMDRIAGTILSSGPSGVENAITFNVLQNNEEIGIAFSTDPGTWSGPVDISTTSVPEPASLPIFAGGIGALAWVRRRRKTA